MLWPGEAARAERESASARFGTCLTVKTTPSCEAGPLLVTGGVVLPDSDGAARVVLGVGAGVGAVLAATCSRTRRGVGVGVGGGGITRRGVGVGRGTTAAVC